MSGPADEAMVTCPPTEAEKAYIRQVVNELIAGTSLQVREQRYELAIFNPGNSAVGQIYVDFEEGHIALRYVAWKYLGQITGFESEETRGTITGDEIVRILACGGY